MVAGQDETPVTLEFELPAGDWARLLRVPALQARRQGRARSMPLSIVWHDTPDGLLAARGLSLSHTAQNAGTVSGRADWRLERLRPDGILGWLPGAAAPLLAEAAELVALGTKLPPGLAPVAAFGGSRRVYALHGRIASGLSVLDGSLRGVAADAPACRMTLYGELAETAELAVTLAQAVPLRLPIAGLAAQAMAVASCRVADPHCSGPAALPPGMNLSDSLAFVCAHFTATLLYWAALVGDATTPEPVHQMRVAVRRLRSALTVFRRAVHGDAAGAPWLDELTGQLKQLAARLGAARDWDVFLTETGADIGTAFPGDRRIVSMLAAARRCQAAAYGGLRADLDAQAWTRLQVSLALLPLCRPWQAHIAAIPVEAYAGKALDRRSRHVLAPGSSLSGLSPHELHEVRKQAKRLRYATEIFAPHFAERRVQKYLAKLERLQAVLGTVNDTAVAAGLMAQLGGGLDRAFAGGAVQGFGAGRAAHYSSRVDRAWNRFTKASPFWD